MTSIEHAGKLKMVEPSWFLRQIRLSRSERWMHKACELGGSVLPKSSQPAFDLLLLCNLRHRIDGASLDRAESLGFLTFSARTLMAFFATFSILDATVSIFSLAKKKHKLMSMWCNNLRSVRYGPLR